MNITPLATPETPTTRSSELHATEFTSHDGTTIVRPHRTAQSRRTRTRIRRPQPG